MPETCAWCGRTYPDSYAYDAHECIPTALPNAGECHEEVTRRGELQPCDLPAVAMRIDPAENAAYPVCKRHVRGPMVPLAAIDAAVRLDERGVRDA